MRSLAAMSLWLVPAVLMYLAYVLFRRLGTNRRSLERLFTEPADLGRATRRRFRGRRIPPPLALPGGLSPARLRLPRSSRQCSWQSASGACRGVCRSRRRLDERIVQEHCPPPARRGRSPCPDCVPGALDRLSDPGARAVAGCPAVASAARGSGGAGFAHLLGIAGHAQRGRAGFRCGVGACRGFGDRGSPLGPRVPHLSVGPLGGQNPRGIAAAVGPPLGSLRR